MEAAIRFFVTLLMLPLFGLGFFMLVRWMVMKEVDALAGTAGLGALVMMFVAAIASPNAWVPAGILLILVSLSAFFPFAKSQMEHLELRIWNAGVMDRAHAEVSRNPGNYAAFFALARSLYDHGYPGHAIALSQLTLNGLSTNVDPVRGTSMRMMFRNEESELMRWMRNYPDPSVFRQVKCPLCGFANDPGTLACGKCGKPYLLELCRRSENRGTFMSKLILGWAGLAVALGVIAVAGFTMTGAALIGTIILAILVVFGILYWMFGRAALVGDQEIMGW